MLKSIIQTAVLFFPSEKHESRELLMFRLGDFLLWHECLLDHVIHDHCLFVLLELMYSFPRREMCFFNHRYLFLRCEQDEVGFHYYVLRLGNFLTFFSCEFGDKAITR